MLNADKAGPFTLHPSPLTNVSLGWAAALSILVVFASARVTPSITWLWGVLSGTLLLVWLCRRTAPDDPALMRIALSSYALRVAVTLVFFAISAYHLPVLMSQQRGGGFLQFGGDGVGYDMGAREILQGWREGLDPTFMFQHGTGYSALYRDLALPLAVLYGLTGASVLHALLGSAWLGAAGIVPAYLTGSLMAGRRSARWAAVLIGFWPSSIIWSTQLLKDSLALVATLSVFTCVARLLAIKYPAHGRGILFIRLLGPWVGLMLFAGVLAYLRSYLGYTLLAASAAVMGPASVKELARRHPSRAAAVVGIVAAIGLSALVVPKIDFLTLCAPWHPLQAHAARAERLERAGDWHGAMLSRIRAVELAPQDPVQTARLEAAMYRLPRASAIPALTWERALELLERSQLADAQVRTNALLEAVALRRRAGDLKNANRVLTDFLKDHPEHVEGRRHLLGLLELIVRSENVSTQDALHQMCSQLMRAEAAWRGDPELSRLAATLFVRFGDDYRQMGGPDEAADGYAQALQLVPRHPETLERLYVVAAYEAALGGWRIEKVERIARALESCKESWQNHAPLRTVAATLNATLARHGAEASRPPEPALAAPPVSPAPVSPALAAPTPAPVQVQQTAAAPVSLAPKAVPSTPQSSQHARWLDTRIQKLNMFRQGMINTGGHSTILDKDAEGKDVFFTDPGSLMAYLPRALVLAFLSPFPGQWLYTQGETGVFRMFSAGEMMVMYVLLPLVVFAMWQLVRFHGEPGRLMVVFSLVSAALIAFTVTNIGTMFRLRLQYLAPLLVGLAVCAPGWRRPLARLRRRIPAES